MKLFPTGDCFKEAVRRYSKEDSGVRDLAKAYKALAHFGSDHIHVVCLELRRRLAYWHDQTKNPVSLTKQEA